MTDEESNCLEKFVCALYSYKNETTVNNVQVKMFQVKGISDLALLPPCKDKLNLHISRANYVANMYLNAIELRTCFDDPIYHRWKQEGTVQWEDDCFPENITDVLETFVGKDDDYVSKYEFTDDESAIPVTLKGRWCYDNVDATTDVDFCTFNFWKMLLPIQFVSRI